MKETPPLNSENLNAIIHLLLEIIKEQDAKIKQLKGDIRLFTRI